MEDYISLLIHNKRIEKGYSLESLSKGICSVSYLSKLESGTITVKDDIVDLILKKLNLNINEDLGELSTKVDGFYNSFSLFIFDQVSYFTEKEINLLLNSRLFLDALIIKAWQNGVDIDELAYYEKYFSFRQKKRYYQILVYENKKDYAELLANFPEIDTYAIIAQSLYRKGAYAMSIPYFIYYFDLACKQCDIDNMINAQFGLGNVYACLFNMEACIKEYDKTLRLIGSNYSYLKNYIYYNIGATYTELEEYAKALEYLNKVSDDNTLYYQKLALCYRGIKDYKKAYEALECGYKQGIKESYILDYIKYSLDHDDYLYDEEYGNILVDTLEKIKKLMPHGFYNLYQRELLKYYEANRKYKDAYSLLKNMQKNPCLK